MLTVVMVGLSRRTDEPYVVVEFDHEGGHFRWGDTLHISDEPDRTVTIIRSEGGALDTTRNIYRSTLIVDAGSLPLEQLIGKTLSGQSVELDESAYEEVARLLHKARQASKRPSPTDERPGA
jgi:hypothetical protein